MPCLDFSFSLYRADETSFLLALWLSQQREPELPRQRPDLAMLQSGETGDVASKPPLCSEQSHRCGEGSRSFLGQIWQDFHSVLGCFIRRSPIIHKWHLDDFPLERAKLQFMQIRRFIIYLYAVLPGNIWWLVDTIIVILGTSVWASIQK